MPFGNRRLLARGLGWSITLLILGFFAAWLLGFGTFIVGSTARLLDARESVRWPQTQATIVNSGFVRQESKRGASFWPKVTYRYTVDSRQFEGTQINFDGDMGYAEQSRAQAVVDRYPRDAVVTVYYKPTDPEKAVLEPGASSYVTLSPILALIAVLFVGFFFVRPLLKQSL